MKVILLILTLISNITAETLFPFIVKSIENKNNIYFYVIHSNIFNRDYTVRLEKPHYNINDTIWVRI